MVARALLLQPRLIIADEPVSMVDASLRATILESLRQLHLDFGISLLYITHDLTTAYQISQNIIVLYRGEVAEAGDVDLVVKQPRHPYTQLLIQSIPKADPTSVAGTRAPGRSLAPVAAVHARLQVRRPLPVRDGDLSAAKAAAVPNRRAPRQRPASSIKRAPSSKAPIWSKSWQSRFRLGPAPPTIFLAGDRQRSERSLARASSAASTRLRTCSFCRMFVMWCLTVFSVRCNCAPISLLLSPAATRSRICRSRSVRSLSGLAGTASRTFPPLSSNRRLAARHGVT